VPAGAEVAETGILFASFPEILRYCIAGRGRLTLKKFQHEKIPSGWGRFPFDDRLHHGSGPSSSAASTASRYSSSPGASSSGTSPGAPQTGASFRASLIVWQVIQMNVKGEPPTLVGGS
jgi:hypothetical protein